MSEKTKRWGQGRIVFLSDLPAIRAEVARGVPLTDIFASRAARLGIGYRAFCKLVSRYAADAKIQPSGTRPTVTETTPPQSGSQNVSNTRRKPHRHEGIEDPELLRKLSVLPSFCGLRCGVRKESGKAETLRKRILVVPAGFICCFLGRRDSPA